ncbi:MAG: glycosyltransferase [Planctomycetota bacterium]
MEAGSSERSAERDKWDAYYRDLPEHTIDPPTAAFHRELLGSFRELLPDGGRLLEAGCGGGNQSLALANDGFDVSLLDFSREALRYAEGQFHRAGVAGEFLEGDACVRGEPKWDLVFNLGVLEHYRAEAQVEFLQGMASRSRRYVVVLIPNPACYWYWVWRVVKAGRSEWPFGQEMPTMDLRDVFERAGMRYAGHAFLGSAWTEAFINGSGDIGAETKQILRSVHSNAVVPEASRAYLVAGLGCVDEDAAIPGRWSLRDLGQQQSDSESIAAIADALATSIGAQNEVRQSHLRCQDAKRQSLAFQEELERARQRAAELEPSVNREIAERDARIAALEEACLAGREELSTLRVELQKAEANVEVLNSKYEEVCSWASRLNSHPLKHFLKRSAMGTARTVFKALPMSNRVRHKAYEAYADMRRRRAPSSPPATQTAAVALPVAMPAPAKADVYVFSIVDWHFRIQRPQHLSRELAKAGHRVFFVSPAHFDSVEPGFQVERLDQELPLYQIRLHATGAPSIYSRLASHALAEELQQGLSQWMLAVGHAQRLVVVAHAFWSDLACSVPDSTLVYDCMDHHEGFGGVDPSLIARENQLVGEADLVLTSSSWLQDEVGSAARCNVTIRNAGDFDLFSRRPSDIFQDRQGRKVIGYFGAIADWFDVALVAHVAASFPEHAVVLIGDDTAGAQEQLSAYDNVEMFGERPYTELPMFLHGFDVCLLPFRVIPLTLATNPVKVYEYLAAGKPVVGTDLPEMAQFGEHARCAKTAEEFVAAVGAALAENDQGLVERRIAFARGNTWADRGRALLDSVAQLVKPRVSVVVLCYRNLELTKACLESLLRHDDYGNMQLIVVDNASGDGTAKYLTQFGRDNPEVRIILNADNLGYAAGTNVGVREADGDYVVLLNNDTVVTPGWLRTMSRHMQRNPSIGLLGPVTNNIGNEAKVDVAYENLDAMPEAAAGYTLRRMGRLSEIPTLAFFCVMVSRKALEGCGLLCEDYGVGWFEDDDYCRRVEQAGFELRLAEDVFVHHELSAAIGQIPEGDRRKLFERNRAIYEEKWGAWDPHSHR